MSKAKENLKIQSTLAYPDLQIRVEGGEGDGHPEPEIRRGHGLKKIFCRPFGSPFGLKLGRGKEGDVRAGSLPWIRHWSKRIRTVCFVSEGKKAHKFSLN